MPLFLFLLVLSPLVFAEDDFFVIKNKVEVLLENRVRAYQMYQSLLPKIDKNMPLNGRELNQIHEAVIERSVLSRNILTDIENSKQLLVGENVDPIKRSRILGLTLLLMDNYLESVLYFQEHKTLRHVINESDSIPTKPGNALRKNLKKLKAPERKFLVRSLKTLAHDKNLYESLATTNEEVNFWLDYLKHSATLKILTENGDEEVTLDEIYALEFNKSKRMLRKIFRDNKKVSDFFFKVNRGIVGYLSKTFGNTAGLVQFRKGYLYNNPQIVTKIRKDLKPLDILMEKTPFRATDRFIPGYWGHNAIYLGTEEELKELGLWDHPVFLPLQAKIRSGRNIVEALRPGVQMNTLEHFMDIDDFLVMRAKTLSLEQLKKGLVIAASQDGKDYDFNFDVETQDVLVCSELIFMAYVDFDFRLERILGRYTINPDAVAERAMSGGDYEVIHLYIDGKEVTEQKAEVLEKKLLSRLKF